MATQTGETLVDLSGYTPSLETISELERKLRSCHAHLLPDSFWAAPEARLLDSHATIPEKECPVLRLSLADLQEIEDAFNFFSCERIRVIHV
jgi:hypothetical protein